jgi:3-hydroxyacyl-CoA dehydrogenase / enoyl-CoA hydratase / 3-hydroxybutyryl-CoA epimerase
LNDLRIGRWVVAKKAAKSLDKLTRGKYPAPYLALESTIYSLNASSIDAALDYEAKLFCQLAVSPESKALMAVYFLMESAKRIPRNLKPKVWCIMLRFAV